MDNMPFLQNGICSNLRRTKCDDSEEMANDYPPATRESKSLWLEVTIVIGLVLIVVIKLLFSTKMQSQKNTAKAIGKKTKERISLPPPGPTPDSDLVDKIIRHTFWRVTVTRPMLVKAIDEIRVKPATTLAYFD